jgi:predicted deacylase
VSGAAAFLVPHFAHDKARYHNTIAASKEFASAFKLEYHSSSESPVGSGAQASVFQHQEIDVTTDEVAKRSFSCLHIHYVSNILPMTNSSSG